MSRTDAMKWLKAIVYLGIYGGLLVPLVFVPLVIFPFVFPKLLYFQVLIGLTFPAYLALAWADPQYRPRWVPLYCAVGAYFIAVALSVIFAVDAPRAWWGNQERMNGLFTLLHFFAWFTMMTSVLKTWKQWRTILIFEVILSAIMACVAILQKPFPSLLLFPVTSRPGGLVDNPIYMAGYQIFNLFFIALLWLKGVSRSTKIWLAAFAILDITAFVFAASRGALVGLFVGIAVFALAYAVMSPSKKTRATVLGVAAAFFLLYAGAYALRDTSFIKHSPLARLTNLQATTATRFIAWKIGWEGFLERPVTGWGFDNFHILFNQKYNPKSLEYGYYETWFDRAHNTVIDTLAMTGILGFLTFFGMFGALFYSVIRAHRKGWIDAPVTGVLIGLPVAYFVQNLFVFDQPAGFTMSFFMYALVASSTASQFVGVKDEAVDPKQAHAHKVPWAIFGLLMACAIVIIWRYSVLPWKASRLTIASNNYFAAGKYSESYALAKQASEIPSPYLDEQTFLQSRNMLTLAENNLMEKVPETQAWYGLVKELHQKYFADHPRNTNPLYIYARFLNSFNRINPADVAETEQYYIKALETSPQRQQLMYSLARFYIEQGNKEKGYETFKRALDANPNVGESHWYVGLSLTYDLNRAEEGSRELIAAMKASSPYTLREVREAVALALAYDQMNDKEGIKTILAMIPTLPNGQTEMYLTLAKAFEHQGLMEERNRLLGALQQFDPTIVPRLAPLTSGAASSIDASFNQTQPVK